MAADGIEEAMILFGAGCVEQAEAMCQRVLKTEPRHPGAFHLLARVNHTRGRPDVAAALAQKACSIDASQASYHEALGCALLVLGRTQTAISSFRRALELDPVAVQSLVHLGAAHLQEGDVWAAMSTLRRAVEINPAEASAHANLGVALLRAGHAVEGAAQLLQARSLDPRHAEPQTRLGAALSTEGKLTEALATLQFAVDLDPQYPPAWNAMGSALMLAGEAEKGIACFQRARDLEGDSPMASSNLLMWLQHSPQVERTSLFAAAREWGHRHASLHGSAWPPHSNRPDPDRPLRVGYISADFREHPVGRYVRPVIRAHDQERFEIFCYSNFRRADEITEEIRSAACHWRGVFAASDDAVANAIRADGIDILVDLSGHTAGHRLLAFARRPAPVQVTWLGYPDTTGHPAIDYIIADPVVCPHGDEVWYTEQVVRLPETVLCFDPPTEAPEVGPLPAVSRGYVTFGCCNRLAKITNEAIACWGEILRALPDARLCLKSIGLNDPGVQARYRGLLSAQGIDPARVTLAGPSPYGAYLSAYQDIDIALDTFPYNGSTTTLLALWMGVPVVYLRGDSFVSLTPASYLANTGLTELMVESPAEYVRKAISLAQDIPALASLRARLRPQLASSVLCDAQRFTQNLETAYRTMWHKWCTSREDCVPAVLVHSS